MRVLRLLTASPRVPLLNDSTGGAPAARASAWSPFRYGLFRALWIAALVSNVGTWMQNVGAAWLMTSLAPSPIMVALVQTATSLPDTRHWTLYAGHEATT